MKPKNSLRKRFIAAESDYLVIETTQTEDKWGRTPKVTVPAVHLRTLKLKGTWRANSNNELCFEVTGYKGPPETYTFKGSWKLNNNQQIEYTSEDGRDTLIFKGYWNISSANRLVYILEGSSTSRFEFKVQLESPILYPKAGQIRYRVGVGVRSQLLILYGEWKFGRNLGITFQMDYGQGKVRSVEFGAEVTFDRNKFILALKNEFDEPLGITLTMTHKFLKLHDAQVFVRLKSLQNEQSIESGITIPF